jgi:ADP-ribose pyrophosphatase YjhB (NUDIX family)
MTNIKCRNNFDQEVSIPKEKFFFRPSVYGVIIHNNQVLFLKNKGNGRLWLPGGGIEIGEKIENGLKREILEETGIEVSVEKFLFFRENFFYYQPLDEAYHAYLFFYLCTPESTALINDDQVDDFESEKPRWIDYSTLKKEDIADFAEDIYEAIKKIMIG